MKRVAHLSETQCERIYASLSPDTKRRLLAPLPDQELLVGEYTDPYLLKQPLLLIVQYVGLIEWGRLKRACTAFNSFLQVPPAVQRIRAEHEDLWYWERAKMFWPWLKRFILLTPVKTYHMALEQYRHAIGDPQNNRRYVELRTLKGAALRVRYPEGIIMVSGTVRASIFDESIETLLFKDGAVRRARQYEPALKAIYERTKASWRGLTTSLD